MKGLGKVLLTILFVLFSVIFLLLSSIYFEILNKNFLFGSFERHQVYEKLPSALAESLPNDPNMSSDMQIDYNAIKNVQPSSVKILVEQNLSQFLNFIHGSSSEISINIIAKDLGFPQGANLSWSMKESAGATGRNPMQGLKGSANYILRALGIDFLVLLGLFALFKKLNKKANALFLTDGIFILILSLILKLLSTIIPSTFPAKAEPSQVLIKIISTSILADITTSWLLLGIILVVLWFVFQNSKNEL